MPRLIDDTINDNDLWTISWRLRLTNKSPSHTGDDCAYFSIQQRCSLMYQERFRWKSPGLLFANTRRVVRIALKIMPRIFSEAVHKTIPAGILSTDYQYCEKKETKSVSLSFEISVPAPNLISSMSMTALIALKYIIASSLFELFVQSARLRRGASPRGKITCFFFYYSTTFGFSRSCTSADRWTFILHRCEANKHRAHFTWSIDQSPNLYIKKYQQWLLENYENW